MGAVIAKTELDAGKRNERQGSGLDGKNDLQNTGLHNISYVKRNCKDISRPENTNYALIPLTKGQFAKIDPEDFDRVNVRSWHASKPALNKTYYACGKIFLPHGKKQHISMHRLIMGAGRGEVIDHVNHDTLDNRKCNLRKCTHSQNLGNLQSVTNKTGFKGVQQLRPNKFSAYLQNKIIGFFKTAEDAAIAYNKRAIEVYGEFAFLNKIPSGE